MTKEISFLNKDIYLLIIRVSLPLIIASIVTSIVQLANVAFMGNLGSEEIYVRSLYTPFAFLLIALIEAFQISNQVSIARLNGEGDIEGIKQNIFSFVLLSIAISLAVWIIIYFLSPYIAKYYNVPDDVAKKFIDFLTLMFLVNILGIVAMVLSSSLRGIGKLGLSMILSIGYALLNITLVYMFSFHWNKGVLSLVYANLISSLTLCIVSLIILMKLNLIKIKKQYFMLSHKGLFFLKVVGIPIFISYIIIFLSNFFYNKIIEPFGHSTLSGFNVGYYVQTFAIIPAIAIGSALGIIINNNIGAGKLYYPRVYQIMKKGTLLTLIFYIIMSALIFIFKMNIAQLMLIDEASIKQAVLFLKIVAPTYIFFGVVLMTITTLEQINKGYLALTLNSVYFLTIIIIGWYLTIKYNRIDYLYWTISITNITGFMSVFFILRMMKKEYSGMQTSDSNNYDFYRS
ncbi:Na+-driven multidrug efflux pump [Oikeobacillus pervagus]|uniref:Na+-driven multidrug efflux pump n=1 Tax=Oikeobacillus pervagus TaxID=1325931 RepID=A0AAJ1T0G5_9BACI|nr:MATE family efflux transporter [Oikeobacillus pervagus]MDQ0216248.1 Na+-driven multidrug efflux pump [Oikeobacillus pervagus]